MTRRIGICALQLRLAALGNNWEAVSRNIELALSRFPWTRMIVLSELAVCGVLPANAEPLPGPVIRPVSRRGGSNTKTRNSRLS